MKNPNYRNRLFGKEQLENIEALQKFQKEIDIFFTERKNNYVSSHKTIHSKVLSLEKSLPDIYNSNTKKDTFKKIITGSSEINSTLFLSEPTIDIILERHPPHTINTLVKDKNFSKNISNRKKLALTRFTENQDWQHRYYELLRDTTDEHYCFMEPICVSVDTTVFKELLTKNGHDIKPWGMSHSKETGVIIVFENFHRNLKTPKLLSLAVFLHYLYEVHHFSRFLSHHKEAKKGELARSIIRKREPLLPFLTDGNAHDETLYWRKAIQKLASLVPNEDWDFFNSSSESFIIEKNEISSAHFIDVLWDINSIYPHKKNFYHLQQEIWLLLEERLSGLNGATFESSIENALMLDNLSFMEQVLKNNQKPI